MTPRVSRSSITVIIVIMILAVVGCRDDSTLSDATASPRDVSEASSSSPVAESSPDDSSGDLRQLAVTLTTQAREGEWDAVRPYVPDEIAALDDSLLHRALAGLQLPAGIGTNSSEWEVEEYSEWTTVRLSDLPFVALVFRQDSDGRYSLDPGPHVLQRAAQYPDEGTAEPTVQLPEGYQQQLVTEDDDDLVPISRHLHRSVEDISHDDSGVTLTVSWMFNRGASGSLPLDGLRWTDGDNSGDVRIVWTKARLTEDELLFPVPEGLEEGESYGYTVSFKAIDAPTNEDLHLLVEGVTLILSGGERFTFDIDHVIPVESH